MLISALKTTKNSVTLTFSNGDQLKLGKDVLGEFYLYIGKELTKVELNEIKDYDAMHKHYQYCLNILSRNNYTVQELTTKLEKREVEAKYISKIIKRLIENNHVNDVKYATEKAAFLINTKKMSKKSVYQHLKKRGINDFIIQDTLKDFRIDEVPVIINLLPRIISKYNKQSVFDAQMKVRQYLYNKGFSTSDINDALANCEFSKYIDENTNIEKEISRLMLKTGLKDRKDYQVVYNKLVKKGYPTGLINQMLKERFYCED